jgi:MarR family transcriptional regulator for hemolysin
VSRIPISLLQRYCLELLRGARTWRRLADAAADDFGLSEATAYPLVFIGRFGDGMRQSALADLIGIEGPSLVRLLDQLCAAGLVVRREDSTDKRAKTLHLTTRGARLTAELTLRLDAMRRQVFESVSAEDIAASLRVFQALERAASQDREQTTDSPHREASA